MEKTIIPENEEKLKKVELIKKELLSKNPDCLLLYGSLARYEIGHTCKANDIDVIYIGDSDISKIVEKHENEGQIIDLTKKETIRLAKWLRYDDVFWLHSKLAAQSFFSNYPVKAMCLAALLLGQDYKKMGFVQRYDQRHDFERKDYSIHKVLFDNGFWTKITAYARNRRGPLNYINDIITREVEPKL